MDQSAQANTAVQAKSSAAGGGPDPEDDNEKDFKVTDNSNMAVSEDAVHNITDGARKKQADFVSMYEEIRQKIENNYGKGNGDYEIYDDLYEVVPNRLPVDE